MGAFFIPILMTFSAAQFQTDNELSAVNQILGAIGQSPITTLEYENPEVSYCYQLLQECTRDIQNEGWVFNRELGVPFTPDANDHIVITNDILRLDVTGDAVRRTTNVVQRDGKLYDKIQHTDEFNRAHNLVNRDGNIYLDVTWLFSYDDLPQVFKRYAIAKAQVRAAAQLVSNPTLYSMMQAQEQSARASCVEYECNQGDYTMIGWPDGTTYVPYSPFRTLQR